ncbi:MAG: DnaB helicase C-terminal domain-containing protein [Candidatus Muirbacterium halophilum]|nr:DnaB helicase C-terminal domain-containing protein [Candidatus Muirbacterium halophilum]MCK9476619.1 DnaB helicase C-terminal domain-containing protein [Candidatus Muirbacterium halophilum]
MEKNTLDEVLKKALKEKPLDLNFPYLNSKINGIWPDLYIISGASSMGKTTFVTQIAWNIVCNNKKTEAIFFSLDHKSSDISIKIASQSLEIPFSYLKNLDNSNEKFDRKMKNKLQRLKKLYQKITLFDTGIRKIISVEDIIDIIEKKREMDPTLNLILIIDQFDNLENENSLNALKKLKNLCRTHNLTIFLTLSIAGECEYTRPSRKNISNYADFISISYAFITLYTDFILNFETPFLEWDWQLNNQLVPITELFVHKNKIEPFTGSVFYRFYQDFSLFRECLIPEIQNFIDMTDNLKSHNPKKIIDKVE